MKSTIEAIKSSPELQAKLAQSTSPEDRAKILREAGILVPTMHEVHEHSKVLAGAAGAGSSSGSGAGTATLAPIIAAIAGASSAAP